MSEIMLDFNILRDLGRSAVRCSTRDGARILIDEMFRQHPQLVEKYWSNKDSRWGQYKPNTTYALHIFDKEAETMQIASDNYWINHGYTIVELKDLICFRADYGEFSASVESIGNLFGLEG